MKINKNLLVGLGIGLLAYYLYTRNKKKVQQPAVEVPKGGGGAIPMPNIAPTTNDNVVLKNPIRSQSLTKEDYDAIKEVTKGTRPSIGKIVVTKRGGFIGTMEPTGGERSKGFTIRWEKYYPQSPQGALVLM
jgi:hypothetical protein